MSLLKKEIEGMSLINNFINDIEEINLLQHIYKNNWDTSIKRRVQHYGIKFEYKYRKIEESKPVDFFPEWLNIIVKKLKTISCLSNFNPNQCTINEYIPGTGIAPHIDTHSCFGNTIVSLSLENDIIMYFQNKITNNSRIPTHLLSKSLLILQGKSRYCYSHGITARKTDTFSDKLVKRKKRVSITFREIKFSPCYCEWKSLCDSQDGILEKTRL